MSFERYFAPDSIEQCVELLATHGDHAALLAGGTDLVVKLRSGAVRPKIVIGLQRLRTLAAIGTAGDRHIQIGAMCTLRDVCSCELLAGSLDVIRQGARRVSSMQIRNMATIGGNSCNGSPSADTVPALIACDASARLVSKEGERILPLEDFFIAPSKTALRAGELLTGFIIPPPSGSTGACYRKYAIRGDTDICIVGVAARVTVDAGRVHDARIVMGAVGPTPLRAAKAEEMLAGERITDELIDEVARTAACESRPITDQRATAQYRREMIRVWTRHALQEAFARA